MRHVMQMTDLKPGRNSFCRCWQSKKGIICDGSHKQWNIDNNDNIGPIVVMNGEEVAKKS
jgi:CDGSH-type Zn-finger protein